MSARSDDIDISDKPESLRIQTPPWLPPMLAAAATIVSLVCIW